MDPRANVVQALMGRIEAQSPAIARQHILPFQEPGQGYAETYPRGESMSPFPSRPAIGVHPSGQALREPDLQNLLGGESLHILGGTTPQGQPIDPGWMQQKRQFENSLTPEQLTTDRFAYRSPEGGAEGRPFDQWMQQSRLDAYLRPALFPMAEGTDPGWYRYTPEQIRLLQGMQEYLKK